MAVYLLGPPDTESGLIRNSLNAAFIFDDEPTLIRMDEASDTGDPWPFILGGRRAALNATLWLNYLIERRSPDDVLNDRNPAGYHAINLLVHVLAGLALFGVVRRTLLSPSLRERFEASAPWMAFGVALIWVVHPLNTQGVTYIVQRGESMMGMCYLATVYCAIRSLKKPGHSFWLVGAMLCCLGGMTSKEVMITAPLMVMLYDRVFTRWSLKEQFAQRWLLYVLLMGAWGWFGIAGFDELMAEKRSAGFRYEGLNSWQYLLTQALVILKYLKLCALPWPLVLDYMQPAQHTRFELDQPWARSFVEVATPVAVMGLMLAMTVWGLWRRHGFGFLGAWFFGVLALTSSILPIADLMVEHRMYLALPAVVTLVVVLAQMAIGVIADTAMRRRIAVVLLAVVVVTFGTLTIRRNGEYHSDIEIWRTVTVRRPTNPRGWHNLGSSYDKVAAATNDQKWKQILSDNALQCWEQVLLLRPRFAAAHAGIGKIWFARGNYEIARERMRSAIEIDPDDPTIHYDFGNGLLEMPDPDLDGAAELYERALALKPEYPKALNNLGIVRRKQERIKEAMEHFEKTLRVDPTFTDAILNIGQAHLIQGDAPQAVERFQEVLRIDPAHVAAWFNLGNAQARRGQLDNAARHFQKAIGLKAAEGSNVQFVEAWRNLAMVRIMQNRPEEAMAVFERAFQAGLSGQLLPTLARLLATHPSEAVRNGLRAREIADQLNNRTGHRNPVFLDILALAYAEQGQFEQAIKTTSQAIELTRTVPISDEMADKFIQQMEERLDLYRQGKPHREDPGEMLK